MISFIIIGRNEGWKLTKCFESVFETIVFNKLSKYEVIYVDSKSTDDSLERAKVFEGIKVYQLTGDINAAIARNVGAKEAKGDVLFFIDGDMEIQPTFLTLVYNIKKGLINDFVSGNWKNYYYNKEGQLVNTSVQFNMKDDIYESTTGGLFLIKKSIWDRVGGMNPIFKKSQDIDLGLRLAKKKIKLLRKKELAAKHHTVSYMDKNRMWKDLLKGNHLYGRSLIIRRHCFNRYLYPILFRNDYSMIILFLSLLLAPILWFSILIYILIVVFRMKFNSNRILFLIMRDFSALLGVLLFYPKMPINISYNSI